mgnify:CR=1 FL=1
MSAEILSTENLSNVKNYIKVTAVCVGKMEDCDGKMTFVLDKRINKSFWIAVNSADFITSFIVYDRDRFAKTYVKISDELWFGLEECITEINTKIKKASTDPIAILLSEVQTLKKEVSELKSKIENK